MLRLELVDISKQYPAVKANDRVSLRVKPGEIHAVLGENGAGKSTLMKIIYGAVRPDEGEIRWNGEKVEIASPAAARALGIAMVYQHFSLFDTLTVAENVWLGLDKSLKLADVTARIREVARVYGLDVDPVRPVHTLSVGEKQRVEIVRALMTDPKLLILDEPTSVLTPQAVQTLFVTLRKLAAEGCSILYISHKLDEIRALCHICTVLRGGKVTGVVDPRQESNASLSRLMIGAEPPQLQHRQAHPGEVVLAVHALSLKEEDPFGTALAGITFDVRAGEVLGIAGISGNGQQELMAAISGEDVRAPAGSITLFGR
ncbi:MAG: ATP-binding cassette domain-containing protein, partial [Pseudomonadota bacterium]|nr:ATP-binding cassette domain-containing protein [Pseudomonadota bacterium]